MKDGANKGKDMSKDVDTDMDKSGGNERKAVNKDGGRRGKKRLLRVFVIIFAAVFAAAGAGTGLFFVFRYKDTDGDGYYDWQDPRPKEWDVGDRDLAIFAKLCYLDGEKYEGAMYPAKKIDEELAALGVDFARLEPELLARWTIADYTQEEAMGAVFSATTYKNGDNLVIAYRGTDDGGEWIWNFVGVGLLEFHVEEPMAKEYALSMAEKYPGCSIYITGHSLGGYLAQFGAAALMEQGADNLEEVVYFNGMGLDYKSAKKGEKSAERELLEEFAKSRRLAGYQVYGDIVSQIGVHSGEIISVYADDRIIEAFKDMEAEEGFFTGADILTAALINRAFDNVVADYYEQYHVKSMQGYFNITHRAENFVAAIVQGRRGTEGR